MQIWLHDAVAAERGTRRPIPSPGITLNPISYNPKPVQYNPPPPFSQIAQGHLLAFASSSRACSPSAAAVLTSCLRFLRAVNADALVVDDSGWHALQVNPKPLTKPPYNPLKRNRDTQASPAPTLRCRRKPRHARA